MPQQDPQAPRSRSLANRRRWWLPFALVVSLLVHLLIGVGVQQFGILGSPRSSQVPAQAPAVQVTLVSPADLHGKEDSRNIVQPKTPTPEATPPAEEKPQQKRIVEKPGPQDVPITPEPVAVATPNAKPTPQAKPTPRPSPQPTAPPTNTTGNRTDRAPRPLPRGQNSSSHALPDEPIRQHELPDATASSVSPDDSPKAATRLKPNTPTRTTGDAGSGGQIASILATPKTDTPKEELGTNGGTGGGEEGGRGNAVGTGEADGGNGLGINRGIPFGDTLGLTRGGDPGGGGGSGAPGAGGVERISGSGGGPHFRVQRPSGGGPPVRIVYVLDVSGSMIEGGKIDRAQEALSKAMDELRPEDSFMIIAFSNDATAYSPTLRRATRTAIAQGQINVRSTQPNGQTNLSAALELALTQKDATHIFILSDGEPTKGITEPKEILTFVQRNNTSHARIITFALGLGENFEGIGLLKKIAQENNGRFDYVNLAHR